MKTEILINWEEEYAKMHNELLNDEPSNEYMTLLPLKLKKSND